MGILLHDQDATLRRMIGSISRTLQLVVTDLPRPSVKMKEKLIESLKREIVKMLIWRMLCVKATFTEDQIKLMVIGWPLTIKNLQDQFHGALNHQWKKRR